jgi:hypothetical protein
MEPICFSETWLTFNGLHGIMSQKIELLIYYSSGKYLTLRRSNVDDRNKCQCLSRHYSVHLCRNYCCYAYSIMLCFQDFLSSQPTYEVKLWFQNVPISPKPVQSGRADKWKCCLCLFQNDVRRIWRALETDSSVARGIVACLLVRMCCNRLPSDPRENQLTLGLWFVSGTKVVPVGDHISLVAI